MLIAFMSPLMQSGDRKNFGLSLNNNITGSKPNFFSIFPQTFLRGFDNFFPSPCTLYMYTFLLPHYYIFYLIATNGH